MDELQRDPIEMELARPVQVVSERHPPVVWALDAFPDDLDLQVKTATALQRTFPDSVVHPVFVLSEDAFLDQGYAAHLRPALKPMAFKAALRVISETHLVHLKKPRILVERTSSKINAARRLARYSRKIGAAAIAVGAHDRKGLTDRLVSHFTTSLMESGDIPVLVAGPKTGRPHIDTRVDSKPIPHRTIVFPTDFSLDCQTTFERLLDIAERTDADIHVLYREGFETDSYNELNLSGVGAGWMSIDPSMTEVFSYSRDDHAVDRERWRRRAAERLIPIHFIAQRASESQTKAIVDYVSTLRETSALLAMVAASRDVILQSPCPILVTTRFH